MLRKSKKITRRLKEIKDKYQNILVLLRYDFDPFQRVERQVILLIFVICGVFATLPFLALLK